MYLCIILGIYPILGHWFNKYTVDENNLQYVTQERSMWSNSKQHSCVVGYITLLVCSCSTDQLVNEVM